MRDYFVRLFDYDRYANLLITDVIFNAGQPEKPVSLMSHLLVAQQIWLSRCKKQPAPGGPLWPDREAETFKPQVEENYLNWKHYLETLEPDDFSKNVHYTNTQGKSFNDTLADILAHVINHGTHHRAQIGQHLKLAGIEKLPPTDFIFYVRSLENGR